MSSLAVGAATEVEAEKEDEIILTCVVLTAASHKLMTSNWRIHSRSDKCRENHREQHKKECQKRKAELRDKELFEQPDGTHLGECPLCFLPLSLDRDKSSLSSCCCELVCDGCSCAHHVQHGSDTRPFC